MDSLQGRLLIASQGLLDPNFAQTVLLIAVHAEEGALGLILNRETTMPLEQIWTQVKPSVCLREGNVWHGGPVGGTLMALHDQRALANLVVTDDLFVATELDAMELLAADEEGQCRFYVGHSGWGPGQLENELAEGSWLVMPATPEHVFTDLDSLALWKQTTVQVGRRQIQSVIPTRHMPENPGLN
ncbi:MAG: YqgE/AlgH family protein [Isosphaeraceae bacterium]